MDLQNIFFGIVGLVLLYLSIKSFILYGKGGAFGIDLTKSLGPGSFVNKSRGEKAEEVLLLWNAIGILIVGLVLCFMSISAFLK